jgi:signal transduction histidine kinase
MKRLFRPFGQVETYAALLYQFTGLVLGTLGLAVVFTGWGLSLGFAITPLIILVLYGFRWAVGLLARVQAEVANGLLGTRLEPPMHTTRGGNFLTRSLNTVRDPAFYRQQGHLLASWVVGLVAMTVVWNALQLLTAPIWYRWVEGADVYGLTDVDTLEETLPLFAAGFVLVFVSFHLVGWLASVSRWLANRLLSGEPGPSRAPAELRALRFRALAILAVVSTGIVLALILIWALADSGNFWPIWPMLALGLVVGIAGWIVAVLENDDIPRIALGSRGLAIQIGVSVVLVVFLVGVWVVTTPSGYFWVAWVALGLVLAAGISLAVVYGMREHRIERLEESRDAAVNVQESELRRIERDLHDGAQARLVALGMSLGMAEEKLQTDPEAARVLLAEARSDAMEALEELRDLARGIHPPILSDRGLRAAIDALAVRSPVPVSVSVDLATRPPGAVETAAYFVVAEALANAIKYADARKIEISVSRTNGLLVAEVVDDGRGGADGGGNGLTGLAQRVRALDGSFRVSSPAGGPTSVKAELPCG